MPKTIYPTPQDVVTLIETLNVVDTNSARFQLVDVEANVEAAIADFEERTGHQPYLIDQADVPRTFSPPGPALPRRGGVLSMRGGGLKLFLDAGLLSLTSLTIGGIPYIVNQQFWLKPDNADVRKKPWTWIEFLVPVIAPPNGIIVTGRWGKVQHCPSNVWQAIRGRAAALAAPELTTQSMGLVSSWTQAGVEETYARSVLMDHAGVWNEYFESQVYQNMRVV